MTLVLGEKFRKVRNMQESKTPTKRAPKQKSVAKIETILEEEIVTKEVKAPEKTVELSETKEINTTPKKGLITNCLSLNVRNEASAYSQVLMVITALSKVKILDESDKEFFRIETENGVVGYCAKEFVTITNNI